MDENVSFILATEPSRTLHGRIVEIHKGAEVHGEEGNTVLIKVAIDKDQLTDPRPGEASRPKCIAAAPVWDTYGSTKWRPSSNRELYSDIFKRRTGTGYRDKRNDEASNDEYTKLNPKLEGRKKLENLDPNIYSGFGIRISFVLRASSFELCIFPSPQNLLQNFKHYVHLHVDFRYGVFVRLGNNRRPRPMKCSWNIA